MFVIPLSQVFFPVYFNFSIVYIEGIYFFIYTPSYFVIVFVIVLL